MVLSLNLGYEMSMKTMIFQTVRVDSHIFHVTIKNKLLTQ